MNNSDVIRMAQGTTPTSEIIKKINSSKPDFRLFPDDVRHLRERHVPASVVDAMFARNLRPGGPYYDPQPSGDPGGGGGIIQRQGETLTINEGTPVRLRLTTNLSSAYLSLTTGFTSRFSRMSS